MAEYLRQRSVVANCIGMAKHNVRNRHSVFCDTQQCGIAAARPVALFWDQRRQRSADADDDEHTAALSSDLKVVASATRFRETRRDTVLRLLPFLCYSGKDLGHKVRLPGHNPTAVTAPGSSILTPRSIGVAVALLIVALACSAGSPTEIITCSGAMQSDGSTPITAVVKNHSSKHISAMELAVVGISNGVIVTGFSNVSVQASIGPDQIANIRYDGKPVFDFLTTRFGPPVKQIRCEPLKVTFADGSTWTKPGPFL